MSHNTLTVGRLGLHLTASHHLPPPSISSFSTIGVNVVPVGPGRVGVSCDGCYVKTEQTLMCVRSRPSGAGCGGVEEWRTGATVATSRPRPAPPAQLDHTAGVGASSGNTNQHGIMI